MSDLAAPAGYHEGRVAPSPMPVLKPELPRNRIGADRFRALTARLRKPAAVDPVPGPPTQPAILAATPAPKEIATAMPAEVAQPVETEPEVACVVLPAPEVETQPPASLLEPPPPELPNPEHSELQAPEHIIETVLQEGTVPPAPIPPPSPTLQEVQARLHEDAVSRLEELDLENVWRQALASPTLEERAQFLQEVAEAMAIERAESQFAGEAVAPEHDLSLIAPAYQEPPANDQAQDEPPSESIAAAPADWLGPTYFGDPLRSATIAASDSELETAELARSLLDMMASGASSGLPQERALAADTLLRLLPKLATKSLALLADRLSIMDNPPQLLVAKLIRDQRVEVSGPLLENCMHIADQDLSMVVAEDNPGKRRMVARRRKLSPAIADELVATKDPSVLLTLVRNANAEISHDGFMKLTEAAAELPEILAPLSTRLDLSAPLAFELFWLAPAQLRRFLLSRFLTDSETLTKILKITLATQDGDDSKDAGFPSPGTVIEAFDLARRGKVETASDILSEALQVSAAVCHRVLCDHQGEPVVVLLKAAGFPRASVEGLLQGLKNADLPLLDQDREIDELQSMFETLSFNKARILLTYWDWAVRKSGPYAPVH